MTTELHPDVAAELSEVCSPDASSKAPEHFASRRVLFAEVDKLIRGRVKEILPAITLEFKKQVDKDLGLDALRARVVRVEDGIAKNLDALDERAERQVSDMLSRITGQAANAALARFDERIERLVAKEVGRQFTLLAVLRTVPKKKRTAKKKAKR